MQSCFHDGSEASGSRLPLQGQGGNGSLGILLYVQVDLVHAKQGLVLRHKSITWLYQDAHKHVLCQAVEGNHNRQSTYKFWDHAKLNHVSGFNQSEKLILRNAILYCI